MIKPEELNNKRIVNTDQDKKITQEMKSETRLNQINSNSPEILTNPIYTPAFLRQQIGKLMRIEFLVGTNNMTDRIGFLEDVGASYILLRSFEGDSLIYADIYGIKFITISANYSGMQNFQNINSMGMQNMNSQMNTMGMQGMYNINSNLYRY